MIFLLLLAVLLLFYGIINKRGKKFFLGSIIILILCTIGVFNWYTDPTYIQISSPQGVNISIEISDKYIELDGEEEEQMINILKETKLYRSGRSAITFADKSTCIIINGRGVDEKYQSSIFYILHDRPNLSFAEIGGRKYKIDGGDVEIINKYLNDGIYDISTHINSALGFCASEKRGII